MNSFAWPAVALILGLVALIMFRKPLASFLERAHEIGLKGIKSGSPAPMERQDEARASESDALLKSFDNQLLLQREALLSKELEQRGLKDSGTREKILLRFLAGASIAYAFSQAYGLIWGSQLGALQVANEAGANGVDTAALKPWYEFGAANNPKLFNNYTFEQWLGFMERQNLVTTKEGRVYVRLEGREFLKFLVQQGHSLFKAG